jgi:hypothetical protein
VGADVAERVSLSAILLLVSSPLLLLLNVTTMTAVAARGHGDKKKHSKYAHLVAMPSL